MKQRFGTAIVTILLLFLTFAAHEAYAGTWDYDPPVPSQDSRWAAFKPLWDEHWNGKNLDKIISLLETIEKKDPKDAEVNLWLSRVYALKAKRASGRVKADSFRKAVSYAVRARETGVNNVLSVKLLVDAAANIENSEEIMAKYGQWIRAISPMPYPEVLDPLPDRKNWSEFKALWDSRQDVEKAVQALRIAEDWARDAPDNGDVQVWAARVCYSIGEYWTSMGKHDENAVPFYKKGIPYGEKAVKMMPHSVPAKYWYNACLGRSVQTASLMKKASLMTKFMDLVLFFFRENPQYNFFGYNITLSPMITNGGWVTEKAMRLAGVTVEGEMASLDMACIIYPDYLSLPYSKALLLAYKGKKNEAIRILEAMMAKNPDISTSITAENRNNLRLARILYNELKKEK